MSADLFSNNRGFKPLAERMRPLSLDDFFGQSHIVSSGKPLRAMLDSGALHSMIFWGPPGVGKTTLALLIAKHLNAGFISLSAVLSGVKEIRQAILHAEQQKSMGRETVLFIDEVHRFNKAQQDAFLPHVEKGTIVFIGATTENPSFELNNALLSRASVYVLNRLSEHELIRILQNAITQDENLQGFAHELDAEALSMLSRAADGDARRALNLLELCYELLRAEKVSNPSIKVDSDFILSLLSGEQGGRRQFDKGGDIFYEQISALHKAVRGSSPDAALYWFARMLDGGCDPLYVARRVLRMASEDIGNADPRALSICLDAWSVYERLGSPEGELALAQAVVYLACAAKSNAVYMATKAAHSVVEETGSLEVPMHIRNAPTTLMKNLNYGSDYRYAPDFQESFVAGENYLPEALANFQAYHPVERGLEVKIKEKLLYYRQLNQNSIWKRYS